MKLEDLYWASYYIVVGPLSAVFFGTKLVAPRMPLHFIRDRVGFEKRGGLEISIAGDGAFFFDDADVPFLLSK